MQMNKSDILHEVEQYYTKKIQQYGDIPQGVDWNGEKSQYSRFIQLCKLIDSSKVFSICDIGCGYGSLFEFLEENYHNFSYTGIDISPDMIETAIRRYKKNRNANFIIASHPPEKTDYCIASGIFNVRQNRSDKEWMEYVEHIIDILDKNSRLGFSFNCLTSYSDSDKMKKYLFYGDPCYFFDMCKRKYAKNVALLHDYGLYEFTIIVKKYEVEI